MHRVCVVSYDGVSTSQPCGAASSTFGRIEDCVPTTHTYTVRERRTPNAIASPPALAPPHRHRHQRKLICKRSKGTVSPGTPCALVCSHSVQPHRSPPSAPSTKARSQGLPTFELDPCFFSLRSVTVAFTRFVLVAASERPLFCSVSLSTLFRSVGVCGGRDVRLVE